MYITLIEIFKTRTFKWFATDLNYSSLFSYRAENVCLFWGNKGKKDLGKFNMLSPLIWQYAFFSFGKLGGEVHKGITFSNCCFL